MVNDSNQTRKTILDGLRNSSTPLSGARLAEILDMSRVAVWKHIQVLREMGYDIDPTPSGYILQSDGDHLYRWEFEKGKEDYKAFRELDSTMEEARREAAKGCRSFTTIVAESQSEGRGRGTRKWDSREGGLYFTWVIRPELPLPFHYIYTLAAATALSVTAEELYGIHLRTKWPNDLLWENRKAAGILAEMETRGDRIEWLNLGMGINVNNRLDSPEAVSLEEIRGSRLDRKEVLLSLEKNYRKILIEENPLSVRRHWEKRCGSIGKKMKLKSARGETFSGRFTGLDPSGSLILEKGSGKADTALFGDIYIKEGEIL